MLGQMAPYLLFGFLAAGRAVGLHLAGVRRAAPGRPGLSAGFESDAFRRAVDVCSCGVIPVVASFRRHGASRAAATRFCSPPRRRASTASPPPTAFRAGRRRLSAPLPSPRGCSAPCGMVAGRAGARRLPRRRPVDHRPRVVLRGPRPAERCPAGACNTAFLVLPRDIGSAVVGGRGRLPAPSAPWCPLTSC